MMTSQSLVVAGGNLPVAEHIEEEQFATMRLGDQLFGISVMAVQDVIRYQPIAPIPLAPKTIAGSLNVRGRIVTALDMRHRLGLGTYPNRDAIMMMVVEYQHELFALMVDAVGDVLSLTSDRCEKVPSNMDASWRAIASSVFKLEQELLVIIDVANVIGHLTKGRNA
jgi:purine-binding chemotaxis protein CheW